MAMLGEKENISILALHTTHTHKHTPHTRVYTGTHKHRHTYLKQQYFHLEITDDNLTKREDALGTLDPEKRILIVL